MPHHHTPEQSPQSLETTERKPINDETAAKIAMAMGIIESRYKENVASYAQALHACSREIEIARSQLEALLSQKKPMEERLQACEKEVDYQMRLLTRLSEQWIRKKEVFGVLEEELSRLHTGDTAREGTLRQREREIKELDTEIEMLEETLLKEELEKQNVLLKLEPLQQQIRAQKKILKALEAQKAYIESSQLHRITQIGQMDNDTRMLSLNHNTLEKTCVRFL